MQCPACNGNMWDNRATKRNPKGPDYKCKNQQCGKAVWEKALNGAPNAGTAPAAAPTGGRALGPLYNECLGFAKAAVGHNFGNVASTEDVIAAAATLFIGATKTGRPIRAAKPAPPPPPPPPPPPAPDAWPNALDEQEDDLPF